MQLADIGNHKNLLFQASKPMTAKAAEQVCNHSGKTKTILKGLANPPLCAQQ
jgi:hypothetical protein